jgi:hypothetical protein
MTDATSITTRPPAVLSPAALMARAGHSDFKTTQGYIDPAGETFRAEAELLEQRLFGVPVLDEPIARTGSN